MLISQAYAQTAPAAEQVVASGLPEGMKVLIQILLIFFVLYFLMIRPQQKKMKEHQAQLNAIIKGTKLLPVWKLKCCAIMFRKFISMKKQKSKDKKCSDIQNLKSV